MTIETGWFVGVISGSRAPNRHEASRFHYAITRKAPPSMLLVAGFAATEKEAVDRVQEYLLKFGTPNAVGKIADTGTANRMGSARPLDIIK
jgi:hypothetical protein